MQTNVLFYLSLLNVCSTYREFFCMKFFRQLSEIKIFSECGWLQILQFKCLERHFDKFSTISSTSVSCLTPMILSLSDAGSRLRNEEEMDISSDSEGSRSNVDDSPDIHKGAHCQGAKGQKRQQKTCNLVRQRREWVCTAQALTSLWLLVVFF